MNIRLTPEKGIEPFTQLHSRWRFIAYDVHARILPNGVGEVRTTTMGTAYGEALRELYARGYSVFGAVKIDPLPRLTEVVVTTAEYERLLSYPFHRLQGNKVVGRLPAHPARFGREAEQGPSLESWLLDDIHP